MGIPCPFISLWLELVFLSIEYFVNPWKLSARVSNNNNTLSEKRFLEIYPPTWIISPKYASLYMELSTKLQFQVRHVTAVDNYWSSYKKCLTWNEFLLRGRSAYAFFAWALKKLLMKPKKHPCGNYNRFYRTEFFMIHFIWVIFSEI